MDNQNINNEEVNTTNEKTPSLMRESVDVNGNVVDNTNQQQDMADKTINVVEDFINTEDHKEKFNNLEVQKYKVSSCLCYLPLVELLFILKGDTKKSEYLRFHANQGLVVTMLWITVFLISTVLSLVFTKESMLRDATPGWVSFISYILYCTCFVTSLFGIITTSSGSSKEIPLIGKVKILK